MTAKRAVFVGGPRDGQEQTHGIEMLGFVCGVGWPSGKEGLRHLYRPESLSDDGTLRFVYCGYDEDPTNGEVRSRDG